MNATLNLTVSAHHGSASVGGMFITETFLVGKIVKVNAKSIRVQFSEEVKTCNGKETSRKAVDFTESFRFWKELSTGESAYTANIHCWRYLIKI